MPSPYNTLKDQLDVIYNQNITNFTNAENALIGFGASDQAFMEIAWRGNRIVRLIDDSQISSLGLDIQFYYIKQLNQLFKLCYEKTFYIP